MNNNATQKEIIKILTQTHQAPRMAYIQAIKQAHTREQAEQIKRIAGAFKIDLSNTQETQAQQNEIVLNLLEKSLNERTQGIACIIDRIEQNEIKHSSKAKKEHDLNIQKGFKMALEVIQADLKHYKQAKGG